MRSLEPGQEQLRPLNLVLPPRQRATPGQGKWGACASSRRVGEEPTPPGEGPAPRYGGREGTRRTHRAAATSLPARPLTPHAVASSCSLSAMTPRPSASLHGRRGTKPLQRFPLPSLVGDATTRHVHQQLRRSLISLSPSPFSRRRSFPHLLYGEQPFLPTPCTLSFLLYGEWGRRPFWPGGSVSTLRACLLPRNGARPVPSLRPARSLPPSFPVSADSGGGGTCPGQGAAPRR